MRLLVIFAFFCTEFIVVSYKKKLNVLGLAHSFVNNVILFWTTENIGDKDCDFRPNLTINGAKIYFLQAYINSNAND